MIQNGFISIGFGKLKKFIRKHSNQLIVKAHVKVGKDEMIIKLEDEIEMDYDDSCFGMGVVHLPPHFYCHIQDHKSNGQFLLTGPLTYTLSAHEELISDVIKEHVIPFHHYCIISNPCLESNHLLSSQEDREWRGRVFEEVKLNRGEEEVRVNFPEDFDDLVCWRTPFPLFPGELMTVSIRKLIFIEDGTAVKAQALRGTCDLFNEKKQRFAGEKWLVHGPRWLIPRIDEEVLGIHTSHIVKTGEALKVRALLDIPSNPKKRVGSEWLVSEMGQYIPSIEEEVVGIEKPIVLTQVLSLHLRANATFRDILGKERVCGEEWLLTQKDTPIYTPEILVEIVKKVPLTIVSQSHYCVVCDPYIDQDADKNDGERRSTNRWGEREVRTNTQFFLRPGEYLLDNKVFEIPILGEDESLLLRASENDPSINRCAGDRWSFTGPGQWIPPKKATVEVLERRTRIPLIFGEGVYVVDKSTGKVRLIRDTPYELQSTEFLYERFLPADVEEMLRTEVVSHFYSPNQGETDSISSGVSLVKGPRKKWQAPTFTVPSGGAVQVFDASCDLKQSRVIFGPNMVMLGPREEMTILSLSGGRPKQPDQIKTFVLRLGPEYMTDIIIVDTSDHAKLKMQLSYNMVFDIDKSNPKDVQKVFSVPDFVGSTCQFIGSLIRTAIAALPFREVHQNLSHIVYKSVFGEGSAFKFTSNNLVVTGVDIQSVEPVDRLTKERLLESVGLAIDIAAKSQEETYILEARGIEAHAQGRLKQQKLQQDIELESQRGELKKLKADSQRISLVGEKSANAAFTTTQASILGKSSVQVAKLQAEANRMRFETEISLLKKKNHHVISHQQAVLQLDLDKRKQLSLIEMRKDAQLTGALGTDVLHALVKTTPSQRDRILSFGLDAISSVFQGRTSQKRVGRLNTTACDLEGKSIVGDILLFLDSLLESSLISEEQEAKLISLACEKNAILLHLYQVFHGDPEKFVQKSLHLL